MGRPHSSGWWKAGVLICAIEPSFLRLARWCNRLALVQKLWVRVPPTAIIWQIVPAPSTLGCLFSGVYWSLDWLMERHVTTWRVMLTICKDSYNPTQSLWCLNDLTQGYSCSTEGGTRLHLLLPSCFLHHFRTLPCNKAIILQHLLKKPHDRKVNPVASKKIHLHAHTLRLEIPGAGGSSNFTQYARPKGGAAQ